MKKIMSFDCCILKTDTESGDWSLIITFIGDFSGLKALPTSISQCRKSEISDWVILFLRIKFPEKKWKNPSMFTINRTMYVKVNVMKISK